MWIQFFFFTVAVNLNKIVDQKCNSSLSLTEAWVTFLGTPFEWKERERERERERENSWQKDEGGLEIKICTREQSKWGLEVGWVSIQILPGLWIVKTERQGGNVSVNGSVLSAPVCQRCTALAQRCCCQRLTSWGRLHSPTPNEHLFTKFTECIYTLDTRWQWGVCLLWCQSVINFFITTDDQPPELLTPHIKESSNVWMISSFC